MNAIERIAGKDWAAVAEALDERGHARLPGLLGARECAAIARLYPREELYRSFVDMERHRFGRGHYRYFGAPLPREIAELRRALYVPLARIANQWQERLGRDDRYPAGLAAFSKHCAAQGQERPTPLLLRYEAGGYNCLHQDRYGDVAFPLQVVVLLSRSPEDARRDGRDPDFEGGELLLTEERPRQQSRADAIALRRGEAVIFPNAERPVRGVRGWYRAKARHGVSTLLGGQRTTLGLIFHDAR